MTDFVLSDKKVEMYASKQGSVVKGFDAFFIDDVKEFIRLLKEEIRGNSVEEGSDYYDNCNFVDFERIIDKLAGEKLTK